MKRSILFLIERQLSQLPPAMAVIDTVIASGLYNVNIVEAETDPEIEALYRGKGVKIDSFYVRKYYKNFFSKILNKLRKMYLFRVNSKRVLQQSNYDILWVFHERTAASLGSLLNNKKYILSSYELNDEHPKLQKKIAPLIKNAAINVACEYNRAHIMKVWYGLENVPFIIPNKPYSHPRKKGLECPFATIPSGKIILYQGHISSERNLDVLCRTITAMPGYKLVLMGDGDGEIIKKKYPGVELIDYIKAPFHLSVTSHAYIGVVSYNDNHLNTMYCAPNKIWEYSGFSVPMLANDVPGLYYTVGKYNAGLCINTNDENEIKEAIYTIDEHYSEFSNNANMLYESVNISTIIMRVLDSY